MISTWDPCVVRSSMGWGSASSVSLCKHVVKWGHMMIKAMPQFKLQVQRRTIETTVPILPRFVHLFKIDFDESSENVNRRHSHSGMFYYPSGSWDHRRWICKKNVWNLIGTCTSQVVDRPIYIGLSVTNPVLISSLSRMRTFKLFETFVWKFGNCFFKWKSIKRIW